jgi:SAM-dependent methyltransferase
MKPIDKLLRAWRSRVALTKVPAGIRSVLDVGCGDGYLLRLIAAERLDGIDPTLPADDCSGSMRLCKGYFPNDLGRLSLTGPYDAIFSLAVFEHLSTVDLAEAREAIPRLLFPGGRLIVTVPDPVVDRILDLLLFLRLIDGQSLHEHHGFVPDDLGGLASDQLRLVSRESFQFGLNNVFVFERVGGSCN